MSYSVVITPSFKKDFKRIYKKHKSLKDDLTQLITTLKQTPETGIPLGNNCFKIRLNIKSKNKGKSGGARIITYIRYSASQVNLIAIYDKSDVSSISSEDIQSRIH